MENPNRAWLIVRGSALAVALVVGAATSLGDLAPADRADAVAQVWAVALAVAGLIQVAMVLGVWQAIGVRPSFFALLVSQLIPFALVGIQEAVRSALGGLPPVTGHALYVVVLFALTLMIGAVAMRAFAPRPFGESDVEISQLLVICAAAVAVMSVVPVPFSELAVVTPIHLAMVFRILVLKWNDIALGRIYLCLIAVPFFDVFALVTTLVVANLYPMVGKLSAPPLGFLFTYGLGRFVRDLRPSASRPLEPDSKETPP